MPVRGSRRQAYRLFQRVYCLAQVAIEQQSLAGIDPNIRGVGGKLDSSLHRSDRFGVASQSNQRVSLAAPRGSIARLFFDRALGILEKIYGPDHPTVASHFEIVAAIYEGRGRYDEGDHNEIAALIAQLP